MDVQIDDSAIDTLTVKFWRDGGYNGKPITPEVPWVCHIGGSIVSGCGGSGKTPLAALKNLVANIAKQQRHFTDAGIIALKDEPQHHGERTN